MHYYLYQNTTHWLNVLLVGTKFKASITAGSDKYGKALTVPAIQ